MHERVPATDEAWAPRKLSFAAAREEQRRSSLHKTPAERLMSATELKRRMMLYRGVDLDEYEADFTPRRIYRRPR